MPVCQVLSVGCCIQKLLVLTRKRELLTDVVEVLFKNVDDIFGSDFRGLIFYRSRCPFAARDVIAEDFVNIACVPARTDHPPTQRRSNGVGVDRRDEILCLVHVAHFVAKKEAVQLQRFESAYVCC